jgi:hypothetical protein
MNVEDHRVATQALIVFFEVLGEGLQQAAELFRLAAVVIPGDDGGRAVRLGGLPPNPAVQPVQAGQRVQGRQHIGHGQADCRQADDRLDIGEAAEDSAAGLRTRGPAPCPCPGAEAVPQHLCWRAILACALVLALGLLSHVTPVALWTGCLLVLIILLLPFVPVCGRTGLRGRTPCASCAQP